MSAVHHSPIPFLHRPQTEKALVQFLGSIEKRPHCPFPDSCLFAAAWEMDWTVIRCTATRDRFGQMVRVFIVRSAPAQWMITDNCTTAGALRLLSPSPTLTEVTAARLHTAANLHGVHVSSEMGLWVGLQVERETVLQDLAIGVLRILRAGHDACGCAS